MYKLDKFKMLIVLVFFIILAINAIAYINTYVSEKYELQLIGIKEDINLSKIKLKENEIRNQRIFLIGFSLLLLSGIVYVISKSNNKDGNVSNQD